LYLYDLFQILLLLLQTEGSVECVCVRVPTFKNKEELPQQGKEFVIVPVYEEGGVLNGNSL